MTLSGDYLLVVPQVLPALPAGWLVPLENVPQRLDSTEPNECPLADKGEAESLLLHLQHPVSARAARVVHLLRGMSPCVRCAQVLISRDRCVQRSWP